MGDDKDKVTQSVSDPSQRNKAEVILKANLHNLARKVAEGKTLSSVEIAMLKAEAGVNPTGPLENKEFAKNQTELAGILDVSRKTIQRYIKREDAPQPRSDGRLCIAEWRQFLSKYDVLEEGVDQTEQKARNILLQNEKLELQIAVLKKEYVLSADAEKWGAELGSNIRKVILQLHLIASQVVGVSVADADKILRDQETEILKQLNLFDETLDKNLSKDEPTT